jgi:hypothetical protein
MDGIEEWPHAFRGFLISLREVDVEKIQREIE